MTTWKGWAWQADEIARRILADRANTEIDDHQVRERIRFVTDMLPNLGGEGLAHGHATLAVLHELIGGDSPEATEHARAAVQLGSRLASAWRIMAEAYLRTSFVSDVKLPVTYIDASEGTLLYESGLAPEEMEAARAETRRREPMLQKAFACAERAVSIDPEDERNEATLQDVLYDQKTVLNAKAALARAPLVAAGIVG